MRWRGRLHCALNASIPPDVSEKYEPRTVALVALGSLVVGFVLVFGGGMLLLRPRSRDLSASSDAPIPTRPRALRDAAATDGETSTAPERVALGMDAATAPARPSVTTGNVTIAPVSISRCFDQNNPTVIAGGQCGDLAALDRHIASKAADIARCARAGASGRLMLVLDFRFSTNFMRGWGTPTSSIPNPGAVAACVKTVISPLPFTSMPHQHDRYLVVVPIDWSATEPAAP